MVADKTYLAVPALTSFTLVRAKIREGREYTNQVTGQSIQRIETGGKRVEATLTMYQPVTRDGAVVRYADLGDDSFSYPELLPTAQSQAGGPPVTTMGELLDASVIASLRDVLVEIMTGEISDFAEQPAAMAAIGVPRYFNIDRIQFSGREDRAKEASLRVLLGVYADAECVELRKYIQQDFVSAAVIAEKRKSLNDLKRQLDQAQLELSTPETTVERKDMLNSQLEQHAKQIETLSGELEDVQSLAVVVTKPAIKSAIREITEAVLMDAVEHRPQYSAIQVEALMSRFDAAYSSLVNAINRA